MTLKEYIRRPDRIPWTWEEICNLPGPEKLWVFTQANQVWNYIYSKSRKKAD